MRFSNSLMGACLIAIALTAIAPTAHAKANKAGGPNPPPSQPAPSQPAPSQPAPSQPAPSSSPFLFSLGDGPTLADSNTLIDGSIREINGGLEISLGLSQQSKYLADLRGFFFTQPTGIALDRISMSWTNVLGETTTPTTTTSGGGGNNMNGGVQTSFDVSLDIGAQGLKGGKDDIRASTIQLYGSNLTLASFMGQNLGVRLQSVGLASSRDGSLKLDYVVGNPKFNSPEKPRKVAEPALVLGLLGVSAWGALGRGASGLRNQRQSQGSLA